MKEQIKKILPRNRFARSVSVLVGGSAGAQALLVLTSPILTRLYSPEDFGVLAVYASLLAIIGVIASLRYQLAIPMPEKDEEAAHVTVLSLLMVLGMTLLTILVVAFFREPIAQAVNVPVLASYLWLLPLGLLLAGIYDVFNHWAIRIKAFPAIARTKLTQSLSMVGVQLGGFMLGPLALILGHVSGQAAGNTSLGMLAIKTKWNDFKGVRITGLMQAGARYIRFPIFSTWGGAFNTAGTQLPPLLFAAFFSASAAGIYLLAQRVLAMPMQLIGKAIADVFFSSAADARRNKQLPPMVANIHEKLAQIAMPPALVLVLAGPDLFEMIFGLDWRQAGHFAQWMAPWVCLVFITSPLSTLFSVLEKQVQGMMFQGVLLFTRISALLIGAHYQNLMLAVSLFATGSAICWIGFLIWVIRASGNKWSVFWKSTGISLAWGLLLVSPLMLFYGFGENVVFWAAALCITVFFVACRYIFLMRKAW